MPALAGAPPPKRPLNDGGSAAGQRAQRDFARYFVANYVPWRFDDPPTLTCSEWGRWESQLHQEAHEREDEGSETHDDDRRCCLVAAGRLFTLENVIDGFSVRRAVANVLNKHRARHRTLWKDHPGGAPEAAAGGPGAEQRKAAHALDQLRAKAARLDGQKDMATRLHDANKMESWQHSLSASLPSGGTPASSVPHAGPTLRGQWHAAAQPAQRTALGLVVDVSALDKAHRKPLLPRVLPVAVGTDVTGALPLPPAGDARATMPLLPPGFEPITDAA